MLLLYSIPQSLYCAKTRIVLRHKQLTWTESPPPGGYGSAEYKLIVASGNLPALRDGNLLLADSEAIAEYLEETHREPPMLPREPAMRARTRELSRFHDTRLEPEVRKLFPRIAPGRRDIALNRTQSEAIGARLDQMSRMLADRETGDRLTLADCGYPITFAWIDNLAPVLDLVIEWPGSVSAYRERIEAFPAIADELATYLPALRAFVAETAR